MEGSLRGHRGRRTWNIQPHVLFKSGARDFMVRTVRMHNAAVCANCRQLLLLCVIVGWSERRPGLRQLIALTWRSRHVAQAIQSQGVGLRHPVSSAVSNWDCGWHMSTMWVFCWSAALKARNCRVFSALWLQTTRKAECGKGTRQDAVPQNAPELLVVWSHVLTRKVCFGDTRQSRSWTHKNGTKLSAVDHHHHHHHHHQEQ